MVVSNKYVKEQLVYVWCKRNLRHYIDIIQTSIVDLKRLTLACVNYIMLYTD